MILPKKTLLAIAIVFTGLIGGLYAISSTILLNSLRQAEEQYTRAAVAGVSSVFSQTEEDFDARLADWAAWDDSYAFVQDANKEFIKSNLIPESLVNLKINLALYIQPSGKIVFGTGFDRTYNKKTAIPTALKSQLFPQSPLLRHPNPKSSLGGIVLLPEGPMIISSRPIVTAQGKGPIRGTLIFGRLLNASEIARMSKMARLPLSIHGLNETKLPPDLDATST
jgi:sensor domain CHASE-containing protein